MDIVDQSCRGGVPVSLESKRLIREFLYLIDDQYRASPRAVSTFLRIVNHRRSSEGLDQMLETGLLAAFIPEFAKIQDVVQFDYYHLHSVGVHLLQTLDYLKGLPKGRDILLLDIFSEVENPEALYLAALFHDGTFFNHLALYFHTISSEKSSVIYPRYTNDEHGSNNQNVET